jgi:hypothetical protein
MFSGIPFYSYRLNVVCHVLVVVGCSVPVPVFSLSLAVENERGECFIYVLVDVKSSATRSLVFGIVVGHPKVSIGWASWCVCASLSVIPTLMENE